MEIYVEQMDAITDLLRMLDAWEKRHGSELMIANKIEVRYAQADGEEPPYGHLVDEIGGVWAFRPFQEPDEALDPVAVCAVAEEDQ